MEIIVIGLIDCFAFLSSAFFLKSIYKHGLIKGTQRFSLLVEGILYGSWYLSIKISGLIVDLIFLPFEKFFSWAHKQEITLVVHLTK